MCKKTVFRHLAQEGKKTKARGKITTGFPLGDKIKITVTCIRPQTYFYGFCLLASMLFNCFFFKARNKTVENSSNI